MTKAELFKRQLEEVESKRPVFEVAKFKATLKNDMSIEMVGNAALNAEDAKRFGDFLFLLFNNSVPEGTLLGKESNL